MSFIKIKKAKIPLA